MECLTALIRSVIPFPALQSQEGYVRQHSSLANADAARNLEKKAEFTNLKKNEHLLAHAIRYELAEQDRGSSISNRAQALLVAQTFFGVLLAFSTAIVGRAELFVGWLFGSLVILLGYTLLLVILLTINALRATSGLRYRRTGTSDLIVLLSKRESKLVAGLATSTLANYRHAGIVNTWRSMHLTFAQMCLRNIVFALAALVVVVFSAVISAEYRPSIWNGRISTPPAFLAAQQDLQKLIAAPSGKSE
jgi:hypothetical protein